MSAAAVTSRGHAAERFHVGEQAQVQIGDRIYHHNYSASEVPRFHNRYYEIPRNPSSAFTERHDVYTRLREVCLPSDDPSFPPRQRRFVLYGLGGSGKTQLCLKFAEEYRERFWGIFWIDASSEDNIERDLVNATAVCGLAGEVNVFRRWLSNLPETWLMIFDNADDPDLDLSRYFPVGARGTILITTRNPECRHHAPTGSSWELRGMAVEEAIVLILKMSGVDDVSDPRMRDMAKPVVLTLGLLALAVAQAGAVIRQGVCGMDEFCELYLQHRKELLGHQSAQGGDGYKYTVYTTWEISLRAIEAMSDAAAEDAMEILQMFSFLHHEGISEEIFRRAWTSLRHEDHSDWTKKHQVRILLRQDSAEWDPQALRKALSILSSFSLINRNKNGLVSMHPLVHGWARDRLSRSDEERKWTLTVSTIAVSISWIFQTADHRFRRSLVPHLDACLRFYGDGIFRLQTTENDSLGMAEKFALAYQESGRHVEALELMEKVVATRRTLGEEHSDTLGAIHALAVCYSEVGRQREALELMEKVVTTRKRTLGEEHPDTLSSMHVLAISYSKVGRRQEALGLAEKVVVARERTLGEEHPDTLASMHALAIQYSKMGRRQEALELAEKVMAARERTLGKEHPDTLRSMRTLATSYREAGRRQEALELAEKIVTVVERTLGKEHPDTLGSMYALAISYSEVGRRQEALELTEKVVAASERTLGEEHPDTLASIHALANCYSEVGRLQEALEMTEKVVAARERTLGEEHPDTLGSIHNLAISYSEVGRRQEALKLTERVVAAVEGTLGEGHPDTLGAMHTLAICYSEMGRRQEALKLTEKVVAARAKTLGEEHPDTLASMHALANRYSEVGRRQEALELTEKVVITRERALGEEHLDTLGSIHNLAISYSEVGRRQEALELTERVMTARERTLGEEHPDTLGTMHALANRYSEVGRRQEALELTEKVVAARERTLGEEHPDTLGSMYNLALSYSEVGRRQEALKLAEKVVAARERTLGEEHPDTLDSMDGLANRYSEMGRRQEALGLTERVVAVRKRVLGEEHQDTLLSHSDMTIFEKIPGPSAESPWQHSDPKKCSSNHTTDRLKGKQKTSTRRFWRKFVLIRQPSVP